MQNLFVVGLDQKIVLSQRFFSRLCFEFLYTDLSLCFLVYFSHNFSGSSLILPEGLTGNSVGVNLSFWLTFNLST